MMRVFAVALVLALGSSVAFAHDDDDDDKVPAAEVERIEAVLSDLGCSGYESLKKEEEGVYEIDDAKCKMGTMDIKLDKDIKVLLISRY
jgi:Peptidase propeptide and YPEB domain